MAIAMKVRGVKAPTLAKAAGITRQAIYKLLRDGTSNPDSSQAMAVCEELNIRVEWFLKEKGSMYPTPELTDDEATLVYAFRDLSPENRRNLMKIATTLATEEEGPASPSNPFRGKAR